jgi:hypothetical protein
MKYIAVRAAFTYIYNGCEISGNDITVLPTTAGNANAFIMALYHGFRRTYHSKKLIKCLEATNVDARI